jgi:hypothetical protein
MSVPDLARRLASVRGRLQVGKQNGCPYKEATTDYERWIKGFRGHIASRAIAEMAARW